MLKNNVKKRKSSEELAAILQSNPKTNEPKKNVFLEV
jgi:hypothetical protein